MKACDCCDTLGEPGTTCRECGKGVHQLAHRRTIYVINEDSRSYSWFVASATQAGARREFRRMWLAWCKASGADKDYWGNFSEVCVTPVKLGVGMLDNEVFKV